MDAPALKHRTWVYKGTWAPWMTNFLMVVLELSDGRNVCFFADGVIQEFSGKNHLERLPESWELFE